jgi:hypothetical protein
MAHLLIKQIFFTPVVPSPTFARFAYLKGKIFEKDADASKVEVVLSPNLVMVCLVYLLPLISINILFGDNSLMGQENGRQNNIIVLVVMVLAIFAITQIACYLLRMSFERTIRKLNEPHRKTYM